VTLDQQAQWIPLVYERARKEWPWVGVINFWFCKRPTTRAQPELGLLPHGRAGLHAAAVYDALREYIAAHPEPGPGE